MQMFPPLQFPLQGPIPILQHFNLWIKLNRRRNSAASFLLLGRWTVGIMSDLADLEAGLQDSMRQKSMEVMFLQKALSV